MRGPSNNVRDVEPPMSVLSGLCETLPTTIHNVKYVKRIFRYEGDDNNLKEGHAT